VAEDILKLPISHKDKEYINKLDNNEKQDETMNKEIVNKIIEELRNNYIFLNDINNQDYYDIKIVKENNSNQNIDCAIEIKNKPKLNEEIERKIKECKEKEKILLNLQNNFKKICEDMKIDEKLLEKKLRSLIKINEKENDLIMNKLIFLALDYDNFKKDVEKVKELLINYRNSLFLANCFKISAKKITPVLSFATSKYIIFLNNEQLFQMLTKIIIKKIFKEIIDELFSCITEKILDNEIFKSHKEEYEEFFLFYKEVCYLFPLLNVFDSSKEKEIYELNKDIHLNLSEKLYDKISRIFNQIPKRNGLNLTLSYFKEHVNIEDAYAMSLRRALLFQQKYKVIFPDFKKSSFIFD
jgi:hypothetical protein